MTTIFFMCLLAAPLAADISFTEGDLFNGSSTNAVGQSFQPGLEPVSDPMMLPGDSVNLDSVLFSSGGSGVGNASTRLAIFSGAFYDFDGSDGLFVPTVTDTLGISDNSIDTTALAYGEAINFTFSGLEVGYEDVISAVFVTVNGSNEITPISVSTAFIQFVEDPPGVFNPITNYGGTGNFNATSLFADGNGDGFLEGATDAQDLSFTASFS
ncbi:MAG: hypothetical protein AAGA30_10510, partial [Planctomycetota bacterium]